MAETEKKIRARQQQKHDTETRWIEAGEKGFIPKAGEIIIYDCDDNNTVQRVKIGDDTTNVNNLPFVFEYTNATEEDGIVTLGRSTTAPGAGSGTSSIVDDVLVIR